MTQAFKNVFFIILGIYQLIGGCFGLTIGLYALSMEFRINVFFFLYTIIGLGLFTLSIIAGIFCLKKDSNKLYLTNYNQYSQIISFIILGFAYKFSSGLGIYFGLDLTTSIDFIYEIELSKIGLGKALPDDVRVSLNIIPILILLIVGHFTKQKNFA